MHIVICDGAIVLGGAERVISILSRELVERGNDVTLLLFYNRPLFYEIDNRVRIVSEEKEGCNSIFKHLSFRRRFFKKTKPDLVLSFLAPFNMVTIASMLFLRIPLIVADRNDPRKVPNNIFLRLLRNILYSLADTVVVQSDRNKNYFSGSVKKKSIVIYNPVEMGNYLGAGLECEKKEKIVYVGRLVKQKNIFGLIDAFLSVHQLYTNYKLELYGDGDLSQDIREYVDRLNLTDYVGINGNIKNVFEEIKDARIFVLNSDYEGQPNALIEAMCLGLPVVSTRVSGATEIVQDRSNGLLVDVRDSDGLKDALIDLIEDKELAKRCSANAISVYELFETKSIVDKWINLFNELQTDRT